MEAAASPYRASLWEIIRYWGRVGAVSWGGMYAVLPRIRSEVTGLGWVADEDFDPLMAAATLVPGPSFVSLAALIGYRVRGALGALAAMIALMLPPTILVAGLLVFLSKGMNTGPLVPITRMVTVAMGGVLVGNAWKIMRGARWRIIGLAILLATGAAIMAGVSVMVTVVVALLAGRWLMGGERA